MRQTISRRPTAPAGRRGMRATLAVAATLAAGLAACSTATAHNAPAAGSPGALPIVSAAQPSASGPASGRPTARSAAPTPRPAAPASPSRFATLRPGAKLPSGSQCAAWVRARPVRENKGVNRRYNQATGQHVSGTLFGGGAAGAARLVAPRIDGQFTGTTGQILRWAACKWGIDEDIVKAQAAIESWWRQTTQGDLGADAAACPPGHALGADGTAGQCPQSYGILQDRYPFMKPAWPGAERSTAMNADLAYGIWRACFEGYETWLNTVDRGQQYAAGDAWGCVGRWFSGRWHTSAGNGYVARVQDYLRQRIWEQPNFQQP